MTVSLHISPARLIAIAGIAVLGFALVVFSSLDRPTTASAAQTYQAAAVISDIEAPEQTSTTSERYFLNVPTIDGGVDEKAFSKQFEIQSWNWGVARPVDSSNPSGLSPVDRQTMVVSTLMGEGSPLIFSSVMQQTQFPRITLTTRLQLTKGTRVSMRIQLFDASFVSYETGGGAGAPTTETYAITFGSIKISYIPIDSSGKTLPSVQRAWNFLAEKPF